MLRDSRLLRLACCAAACAVWCAAGGESRIVLGQSSPKTPAVERCWRSPARNGKEG